MDEKTLAQLNAQLLLNPQYMAMLQQTNDTVNLTQNALASGIPTLDIPTIMSYLGYSNSFTSGQQQPGSSNSGSTSGNAKKESNNNLEVKYTKLLEVIEEIGRDVRPLYSGSKGANDRIRRQINQARHLVRECLIEVDRNQRHTSTSTSATSNTNASNS